ncbi:MAG: hypothetical protein ABIH35_02095 [Patescibacteria group bacterium]
MTEIETPAPKKTSVNLAAESLENVVKPFRERIKALIEIAEIHNELGSAILILHGHFNVDEALGDSPGWKDDPQSSTFWDDTRELNARISRFNEQTLKLTKAARARIAAL